MTTEQKEQHILTLIAALPIFQRVRIALTILRGIEPDVLIPSHSQPSQPWETADFFEELDRRYEDMISGKDKGIPAEELLAKIESRFP